MELYERWMKNCYNGGYKKSHSANGINYEIVEGADGWFSIWEFDIYRGYVPLIQAINLEKAIDYIVFREKVNFPLKALVPH